jgi:hypothetical protein
MNERKKIELKGEHLFTHYAFLVLLLISPILNLFYIVEILTGTYDGKRTLEEHLTTSLPFLILAILFYLRQRQRLNYKEFKIDHSDEEIQDALTLTADQLNWTIQINKKGYIKAHRDGGSIDWWGEMITIKYDNNFIFINSISDPNAKPTVSSFGWDKKNVRTFIGNLEKIRRQMNKQG